MVRLYYGSNIDAVNWKIYSDNIGNNVFYFAYNTKAIDVADKLCQFNLFDSNQEKKIYVVNIDSWKLTDKSVKDCIKELHNIEDIVIFAIETSAVKNKIFSELKIKPIKATAVTRKSKYEIVHKLLSDAKINLSLDVEQLLNDILPEKIDFIQNEILKLKLMNQESFTKDEIKQIVFDLGDATVFNIIDSWLKEDETETIERLNDLLSKNITIQAFVPIFALKLTQLKLFLSAKLARWSSEIITAKLGLPFWQQTIYNNLRPYDQNLNRINGMLSKLYEFDINVKKQKNIPYTQLIKILFK